MVRLLLMLAVVTIQYVYGAPLLPPLPMKDGCYVVFPEVNILRVEGEAIILSFPMFERVLEVRNIAPPSARYLITKDNRTEGVAFQGEGRVQQRDKQLWLLPAEATDSGEYICTYRNESYCVTGSIKLQVYESSPADVEKLSYPILLVVGEYLRLPCPSLSHFNNTDTLIEWHKDLGRAAPFLQERGRLIIPAVRRSHSGVYTCRLRALINDQQYKVSRTVILNVEGLDPVTTTVPDLSMTSEAARSSSSSGSSSSSSSSSGGSGSGGGSGSSSSSGGSSSSSTVHTPLIQPPVILSPRNGTIIESLHGSGLELSCKVLTECQMVDSTVVTWLVNDQSVESSYLDGRALQGGRRVTGGSEGCHIELRLVVVAMTEEDVETELKCVAQNQGGRQEVVAQLQLEDSTFTWLVVAAVAMSCFLTVVSVFLYVTFKPKRKNKMDYILARQSSTF